MRPGRGSGASFPGLNRDVLPQLDTRAGIEGACRDRFGRRARTLLQTGVAGGAPVSGQTRHGEMSMRHRLVVYPSVLLPVLAAAGAFVLGAGANPTPSAAAQPQGV